MKKCIGIGITAVIGIVGSVIAYRCGCQRGVDVTETVVKKYSPEAHKTISGILESEK